MSKGPKDKLHAEGWEDSEESTLEGLAAQQCGADRTAMEEQAAHAPADAEPGGQAERAELSAATQESVTISTSEYEGLRKLAQERDEFLTRLQRALADYQNLQKRVEKERLVARRNLVKQLAEDILPVADSLAWAIYAAENTDGAGNILRGLKLVEKEFYGTLEKLSVEPIDVAGVPFDPEYHSAVMQEENDDLSPNTVVRELKKGFLLDGEVIRAAHVSVSTRSSAAPGEQGGESESQPEQ